MVATKYAEGAFAVLSGNPTEVMEQLRLEGVTNSSRVCGFSNTNFSAARDVFVMYWTGGRKVLANLVSWFNFNNNSVRSATTAYDISDNAYNGTLVSGAFMSGTGVDGTLSGALWFSGTPGNTFSGAHVILSSVDAFRTEQGTISAWIYRNEGIGWFPSGASCSNSDNSYNIFSFSRVDQRGAFARFQINSGGSIQYFLNSGVVGAAPTIRSVLSGAVGPTGGATYIDEWVHVAVTCDGNTVRLYQNGREVSSATPGYWIGDLSTNGIWVTSIGAIAVGNAVGGKPHPMAGHWIGMIDNLRIASYCMTPSQIMELFLSKL